MKIENSASIQSLKSIITTSKNVVIISHTNPDGDAIGSSLGLFNALHSLSIEAQVILPDKYPDYYRFLPNSNCIFIAEDNSELCFRILSEADVIFVLDLNKNNRVGILQNTLEKSTAKKILIDHHPDPNLELFDIAFSSPQLSSTSEYIYFILCEMFGFSIITKEAAICLYTGICTDTGSFSYSCNNPSVYEVTAHLVKTGISVSDIHDYIYNSYSPDRLLLLGFCISNRLRIFEELKMAYFYISKADQEQFHVQQGDLEGIVNYSLMMKNIEIGVLIKENSDSNVRISFRSKNNFDVNLFAAKYFNGGGHKKASGAISKYGFEETCKLIESYFQKELLNK